MKNLLAAMVQSRDAYRTANEAGVTEVLDDKTRIILKEVKHYYETDHEAQAVDLPIIESRLVAKHPKHAKLFSTILSTLTENVSVPNIIEEIQDERKRKIKNTLASAFTLSGNDEHILELLEDYRKICYERLDATIASHNLYVGLDPMSILDGRDGANKIRLSPESLNTAAGGGVLRKHHLLLFARPDCLSGSTRLRIKFSPQSSSSKKLTFEEFFKRFHGNHHKKGAGPYQIQSVTPEGRVYYNNVVDVFRAENKPVYRVETARGFSVEVSKDHRFKTQEGYSRLDELEVGDVVMTIRTVRKGGNKRAYDTTLRAPGAPYNTKVVNGRIYQRVTPYRLAYDAHVNGYTVDEFKTRLKYGGDDELTFLSSDMDIHHIDMDHSNNSPENLVAVTRAQHTAIHAAKGDVGNSHNADPDVITAITPLGVRECYDLEVAGEHKNFCAQGVFVHNCGKSTVALNMTASFLHQGYKVLYFGNEDPAPDIRLRLMTRLLSRTEQQIRDNLELAEKALKQRNADNFIFVEGEPGNRRELEALMDEHTPDILIVDQVRNLDMDEDNRVIQLEKAEQFVRNLGKRHNALTISFTQAGGSAEGKLILDMNDVDFSNCLAPETEVRMFDGSSKAIKDIRVGEQVMGLDSTPRTVKAVGGGRQPMYRITHKNGDYYDCNQEHILTLKYTQGQLVDIPLTTYMARKSYPKKFKGVSVGYQVEGISPFTDPWALGVWLGAGGSSRGEVSNTNLAVIVRLNDIWIGAVVRNVLLEQRKACHYIASWRFTSVLIKQDLIENKHIPDCVFKWRLRDRINLLAGLIDADGHNEGYYYELALQGCSERFKQGVKQLCTSIGWYCSISDDERAYITARHGMYLPCAIPYKQYNAGRKKDVMSSRLTIDPLGEGEYRGITVDGDHRYVLANGIVTHNTGMQASADLMVGIGTNPEYSSNNQRVFTCVKNKMSGGHKEPFKVTIDHLYNRVY